jgi:transposase
MRCEFLPPYSPDFNPIEMSFSAIKAHICRHGETIRNIIAASRQDDTPVYMFLYEAVATVTAADAKQWYRACGYAI